MRLRRAGRSINFLKNTARCFEKHVFQMLLGGGQKVGLGDQNTNTDLACNALFESLPTKVSKYMDEQINDMLPH